MWGVFSKKTLYQLNLILTHKSLIWVRKRERREHFLHNFHRENEKKMLTEIQKMEFKGLKEHRSYISKIANQTGLD